MSVESARRRREANAPRFLTTSEREYLLLRYRLERITKLSSNLLGRLSFTAITIALALMPVTHLGHQTLGTAAVLGVAWAVWQMSYLRTQRRISEIEDSLVYNLSEKSPELVEEEVTIRYRERQRSSSDVFTFLPTVFEPSVWLSLALFELGLTLFLSR